MIVIWKGDRPTVRCRPGEFAEPVDVTFAWYEAINGLREWGMTHEAIADAIGVSVDSVRGWVRENRSRRPHARQMISLQRLHAAAAEAVAKGPACST